MFINFGLGSFARAAVCVGTAGAAARFLQPLRLVNRNKQDCVHLKQPSPKLQKQAGSSATGSSPQHVAHCHPPQRHYQQQQRALAAAEELAQAALAAAEYTASLRRERESVEALQKQQLALQQRLDDLTGIIACLSLQTSNSSNGGSCRCPDGSSSTSTGSSRSSSVRPVGSSWFTRAAGMAEGSGTQAMLLELQDLMQQSRADEAEIEAVRTELLALTDGHIHAETALRDELARRVAALEDEVQQEDEVAEDDQAYISSLQTFISHCPLSCTCA